MALWPTDKVPSGLPPSSCQSSQKVQSPEQKGLVYTYNSANLPGSGVYGPRQFVWVTKQSNSHSITSKPSVNIWFTEQHLNIKVVGLNILSKYVFSLNLLCFCFCFVFSVVAVAVISQNHNTNMNIFYKFAVYSTVVKVDLLMEGNSLHAYFRPKSSTTINKIQCSFKHP